MQNRFGLRAPAACAIAGIILVSGLALGQDTAPERPPVKRVVVYDTGVAFIEHEGKVSGSKELTLDLPDRDVNDLLKSMVVQDLGGGRVSWAALPTSDNKTAPLKLTDRKDLSELLTAMRGMRVRIGSAAPVEGELLLVENRTLEQTKEIIPQATLLTSSGIVRVEIKNGESVQILEEDRRRAFAKSTELLDSTLDLAATRIRLSCEGEGERQVRVGYVAAMPIWKTSYRLVLREDGKSLLQAWALIENATQTDWSSIECTLVRGRSLGFQTDLRKPLTITRPYRAPERYAALAPETHRPAEPPKLAPQVASSRASDDPTNSLSFDATVPMPWPQVGGMGGMAPDHIDVPQSEMSGMLNARLARWREESSSVPQSVGGGRLDAASALGESTRYRLKGAVSIAKGETGLLHLLDSELEGSEISLFNPSIHSSHPLHAVQVANTSGGVLPAGPVAIFSGDAYRGDALVGDWQMGEKRILSYAIDTQVRVGWHSETPPIEWLGIMVTDENELVFVVKESLKGKYVIENHSTDKKAIWIEHPRFKDWTLTAPEKVSETTDDRFRLQVLLDGKKQSEMPVAFTRYRLMWPDEVVQKLTEKEIAATPVFSEGVRKYLSAQRAMHDKLIAANQRLNEIDEQHDRLASDQERLRENAAAFDKHPDLATTLVQKLLATEKKIDDLDEEESKVKEFLEEDETDEAASAQTKASLAERTGLLPRIQTENPLEKLPYKPSAEEIKAWRSRRTQFRHTLGGHGMGGMGGMGMGGMGGGFF